MLSVFEINLNWLVLTEAIISSINVMCSYFTHFLLFEFYALNNFKKVQTN